MRLKIIKFDPLLFTRFYLEVLSNLGSVRQATPKPIKLSDETSLGFQDINYSGTSRAMSLFLSAAGLMMILEGVPYFCLPSQVKEVAKRLPELPDSTLRIFGFFLMLLGLLVVYIGRKVVSNG